MENLEPNTLFSVFGYLDDKETQWLMSKPAWNYSSP